MVSCWLLVGQMIVKSIKSTKSWTFTIEKNTIILNKNSFKEQGMKQKHIKIKGKGKIECTCTKKCSNCNCLTKLLSERKIINMQT